MSLCPRCRTLNPASETTCLSCGSRLETAADEATCPQGHPIDPSWAHCPYCALTGQHAPLSPSPSVLPPPPVSPSPPISPSPPVSPAPRSRPTRLEVEARPPAAAARRTRFSGAAASEAERELVAVLAAPRLRPGGAIFPVRVGKSFLGAHAANDVCLREDAEVSGEHALLLSRNGRFYLSDRMSTHGTWVNGLELDAGGQHELADRDLIRCGTTELVLLVLPPPASSRGAGEGGESR